MARPSARFGSPTEEERGIHGATHLNVRILLRARAVTGVPLRHKHEKSDGTERLGRPSLCLLEGGPVRKEICGVVSLYVDIP